MEDEWKMNDLPQVFIVVPPATQLDEFVGAEGGVRRQIWLVVYQSQLLLWLSPHSSVEGEGWRNE